MHFIDTHSHIYLEDFDGDIDDVIQRAINAGVQKIILPNIDSLSIGKMRFLTDQYPILCTPLIGLHPTHIKHNYRDELDIIISEIKKQVYKGIGEIGIDLYWDKTFYDQQVYAFKEQLHLSLTHNLPVVIHARESLDIILEIIDCSEYKHLRGIFHAFTGTIQQAEKIIRLGFKIGLGGILTFKHSGLSETVSDIDLKNFVLETDSPYLTPTPYRGKRNESSYIKYIAQRLAEIKNVSVEEVAEITSENARKLFTL